MVCTVNASVSSSGIVSTADGSGVIKVQSNGVTTNALAWVNFNGVTTATVRSSYNVSSVTRTATGTYTVNFSNAMSDANYCVNVSAIPASNGSVVSFAGIQTYNSTPIQTTSAAYVAVYGSASSATTADSSMVCVSIFGN